MATSPAQAFASWSPAGASAAADKLMSLPSMAGGMPSIPSLTQSSSADGKVNASFDNSGWTVVQRGAASTGSSSGGDSAAPGWLLPAAIVLAVLAMRHGSKA